MPLEQNDDAAEKAARRKADKEGVENGAQLQKKSSTVAAVKAHADKLDNKKLADMYSVRVRASCVVRRVRVCAPCVRLRTSARKLLGIGRFFFAVADRCVFVQSTDRRRATNAKESLRVVCLRGQMCLSLSTMNVSQRASRRRQAKKKT